MSIVTGFRFFDVDAAGAVRSRNGSLTWPAPNGKPGEWVEHKGAIRLCATGLHASPTVLDALRCRQGTTLGRVDVDQIEAHDEEKFAARRMRIIALYSRQHVVGLAALAAAMSLKYFETRHPNDVRPRKAILACLRWIATKQDAAAAAADAAAADAAAADASAAAAAAARRDGALAARAAATALAAITGLSAAVARARAAGSTGAASASTAAGACDSSAPAAAARRDGALAARAAAADARKSWRDEFNSRAVELLALPVSKIPGFVRKHMPARAKRGRG